MTPATNLLDSLRLSLPPDLQVDNYLDAGGQGAVFRGRYREEDVALKVFAAGQDPRRLEREIALLREIDHPNLVKIRTAVLIDLGGQPCSVVAYEFLTGGDLRGLLEPATPVVGAIELARVGEDVSSAIETLWSKRI